MDPTAQPQFPSHGHRVLVRNTFLDVDDCQAPAQSQRSRTVPPGCQRGQDDVAGGEEWLGGPEMLGGVMPGQDFAQAMLVNGYAWHWVHYQGHPHLMAMPAACMEHPPGMQLVPIVPMPGPAMPSGASLVPAPPAAPPPPIEPAPAWETGPLLPPPPSPTPHGGAFDSWTEPLYTGAIPDVDESGAAPFPPQPQTLHVARSFADGDFFRAHWVVDARKLRGNDHQVVSPAFHLHLGRGSDLAVPFKMMICTKRAANVKGGSSFKSVRGKGIVKLKCEGDIIQAVADVSFRIAIGPSAYEKMQPPRGPMQHDFAKSAVCGLAKGDEEWEFSSAVDTGSLTFIICLEAVRGRTGAPEWGAAVG